MGVEGEPDPHSTVERPLTLRRLLPAGDPATVQKIIDDLGLPTELDAAPRRPYVMLNMVSTADGRASIDGRSGALGNRADRELFHGLRSVVDGVMAGAGTVRSERYGRL